jgi:hypothetical protein
MNSSKNNKNYFKKKVNRKINIILIGNEEKASN